MAIDVLPDSRTARLIGVQRHSRFGNQVPIFCANCGKPGGFVNVDSTHAFYLCQPCADAGHGDLAHFYEEPDHVWRKRAAEAQLEEHQRFLTPLELAVQLDDPSTTLAKLAAEWRAHVLRKSI